MRKTSALLLPLLAITSCSGGGSDGGGNPPPVSTVTPTPTPTAAPTATPTPAPTASPTPIGTDFLSRAAALYTSQPDIAACQAGQLHPAVITSVVNSLNQIRALHRLPPVTYSPADEASAQQAALIMAANNALSHNPPSTWTCYSALGSAGAGASNLYGGYGNGLTLLSEEQVLAGWMTDVDNLVLDGQTTAKIFNGSITTWNDPAIAALNEGVDLPATAITPIVRSDSSGTTDNFQQYLEVASGGAWTTGAGSDFTGGVGEGAKGSAGVAQAVSGSPGSITYVEKSFADQNGLSMALLDNGSGPVELTEDSAAKAIEGAGFSPSGEGDLTLDLSSIFGSTEEGTYPLVLATYEIVCSAGYDADTAAAVKSFLTSAANEGQDGLGEQGYVPLPDSFKERLTESIDAIAAE